MGLQNLWLYIYAHWRLMRAYIEVVCILLFGCITHFSAILTTQTGTSLILTGTFRKVLHRPSSWFIKSIKYFVYIKSVKVHKSPLRFNVATTFQKYFGILPKYAYTLILFNLKFLFRQFILSSKYISMFQDEWEWYESSSLEQLICVAYFQN